MSKAIVALVIPISGDARPDNSLPGAQPGPDNTLPGGLPRPEQPIYYPIPPGGVIDNTLPGSQPGVDNTLPGSQPQPEHPIFLPPNAGGGWLPVYIWGPNDPRPGTGLPGSQPGVDNTLPPIEVPPEGETDDGRKIKFVCGWTPSTGWVSFAIVVPGGAHVTPSKRK